VSSPYFYVVTLCVIASLGLALPRAAPTLTLLLYTTYATLPTLNFSFVLLSLSLLSLQKYIKTLRRQKDVVSGEELFQLFGNMDLIYSVNKTLYEKLKTCLEEAGTRFLSLSLSLSLVVICCSLSSHNHTQKHTQDRMRMETTSLALEMCSWRWQR
jgi:hypothetical protein